jgi:ParB family chromosome partitioning protein
MSEPLRPETPLDLELLLRDYLPRLKLDRYFEFTEDEKNLFLKIVEYVDPEVFRKVKDLVRTWGGEYQPAPSQRFVIPKDQSKPIPAEATDDYRGAEIPRFTFLATESILSMPFQSRTALEDPEISDLAGSMQRHGVLEPLLVRRKPSGNYELVAGHRRLEAAKKAGLKQVPCIIREMTDQEALEAHFIENLQRKDLSDYEKARMLDYLLKKFPEEYPTKEALAAKVGKSRPWVSNMLRMLELESTVSRETLSRINERHAREILATPEEKRPEVIEKITEEIEETGQPPSVRELRKWREAKEPTEPLGPESEPPPEQVDPEPIPRQEGIDTGLVFQCPECGYKATHIHYSPEKHTLQEVRET